MVDGVSVVVGSVLGMVVDVVVGTTWQVLCNEM